MKIFPLHHGHLERIYFLKLPYKRILEDFLCVMNTHCSKLCDILEPRCGGPEFDVFPLVTHCALDIICETAMGRSINAQEDSDTPYVRAIYQASDVVFQRQRYTLGSSLNLI